MSITDDYTAGRFGLSFELAMPLMAIVDPICAMIRGMNNVALNSHIPVLAAMLKPVEPTAIANK